MNKNKKFKIPTLLNRRDVLKIAGATGAAVVVTQAITTGPLSAESLEVSQRASAHGGGSGNYEWHMGIDLSKCIGCRYCLWACQANNDVPLDEMRWNIGFPETTEKGQDFFMTRPCLHCQEAPCTKVCPVGATYLRDDGIIAMDYDRCIGCRYCEVACPYDVRRFNWKNVEDENKYVPAWGKPEIDRRARGVVEKCTFCMQRIDRGLEQGLNPGVDPAATPACVNICPVGARVFGNIRDEESPISVFLAANETFRLREDFGTEPKVHYVRPEKEG